ncbi:MAG: endo-1,4-beta-xylanase [Candidatus Bathyarchaeia archaeon]
MIPRFFNKEKFGEASSSILVIEAFDERGNPFAPPYIYASDSEGEPFPLSFWKEGEVKWVCPLFNKPFFINVIWEIKGFGKLILTADNEGKGYKRERQHGRSSIILNYELAKSHLKRILEHYESGLKEGYILSSELKNLIQEAQKFLKEAENASDKIECLVFLNESLRNSLWAGEKLALEIAKQNIEKFRKANVTIRIVDETGKPIENAKIVVKQIDHEIMFACNTRNFEMRDSLANFDIYLERFKELFNAGMVHFFWPTFEPEEEKYRWETRDVAVNWLKSNGLRIWGHLLIWLHEWNVPEWAKRKTYRELKEIIRKLCYEPACRYRDSIYFWNVFNEPEWGNVLQLSVDQQIELLKIGLKAVNEANPEAVRMINLTIIWGEYVAWERTAEGLAKRRLLTPIQFLKEVERRGIYYEAIGLQLYMGFGGTGSGFSVRDMFTISKIIEKYSQLGKEIHITELGTPSRFENTDKFRFFKVVTEAGYWHKPWDEETQADWIEQFYTIAFGNPNVKSISWFDLADYKNAFVPWSGLLNEDMTPKRSYYRLKNLLNSWLTNNEGITNKYGEYSFRGFKGRYKIKIMKDEKMINTLDLNVKSDIKVVITLDLS